MQGHQAIAGAILAAALARPAGGVASRAGDKLNIR